MGLEKEVYEEEREVEILQEVTAPTGEIDESHGLARLQS